MPQKRLRAGIIPYAVDLSGEVVLLFGKELGGKWSPLAGTVEKGEDIKEAAIREFTEEIMGLIDGDALYSYLDDNNLIIDRFKETESYYYLVPLDWDPNLPNYFANVTKFFLKCTHGKKNEWNVPIIESCEMGLFEKEAIDWFRLNDLKTMSPSKRRELFSVKAQRLLDRIVKLNWE